MKKLLFAACLFVIASCNNSEQSATGSNGDKNDSDTTSVNRAARGTGTDLNGGTSETGTITDSSNNKKSTGQNANK